MVSSLVVIFAVVELLVLPFAAGRFLYHEPMVAGAWMGLAVKTDGAAVAAGTMADSRSRFRPGGCRRAIREGLDHGRRHDREGLH